MSESPGDIQALEKISSEIGDSQIKITLSSQCIKAQTFLVDKLRKQSDRQKEICNFIRNSNLKLQTEITQAGLEIKSLTIAHETIKSSNVELKKESYLIKERKFEIEERIKNGEKKYEELWLQAKHRYESIPVVQNLLQYQENVKLTQENIDELEKKSELLLGKIEEKKRNFAALDKKRVLELADFIVNYMTTTAKNLEEKKAAADELYKEIMELQKQDTNLTKHPIFNKPVTVRAESEKETGSENKTSNIEDEWFNICQNNDKDSIQIPRIKLMNTDFDKLSAKLDKIKIKKREILNIAPVKRGEPLELDSEILNKKQKTDDDVHIICFNKSNNSYAEGDKNPDKYSKRKLINILEDINLDKNEAYDLVSKVDPVNLTGVNEISVDTAPESKGPDENNHEAEMQADEVIEEIDLTKRSENLLIPPTQFLNLGEDDVFNGSQVEVTLHMTVSDTTSSNGNHRNKDNRKKVSFDEPISMEQSNNNEPDRATNFKNEEANETVDSQINESLGSEESYSKIKDMILRKHNLDLSPQFVYGRNNIVQISNNENLITSKFFSSNDGMMSGRRRNTAKITEIEDTKENSSTLKNYQTTIDNAINMDVDEIVVSSPKETPTQNTEKQVNGLLFNHGASGIPDSLNVSISTTGFDEGDGDFAHGIDSSLLLSPKADLPLPMSGENAEISSQEVPNFLSGLRKTGFSFFGQSANSESKSDEGDKTQNNNFNFNFGGDEKKGRGLFGMFR